MTLNHFLVLGAILFCVGLYGALAKGHAVAVLMGIELMLNSVNITLVGFARFLAPDQLLGQVFAVFVITAAAAEAAVGLAIVLVVYRQRRTVNVEEVDLLKW
ncbi:MAG: NADH-quinone oxidoreductase subunit NuoK [Chloroflexi bacterium]|nr:NADH-quinone oxidoreductase subunit NuoK [Chloroflexota bacterium]MCL5110114.1 NADH-quinone oxidoreductase subunit NuoK [Chloroflexota bacterium]